MPAPDPPPAARREALTRAFRDGTALPDVLALSAVAVLQADWPSGVQSLADDALLAELMVSAPIPSAWIERRLNGVRRWFLHGGGEESLSPFLARLALQCHLNEYAWPLEAGDLARVEALASGAERLDARGLLTLACYQPLSAAPAAAALAARAWPAPVMEVLRRQVSEAREEQALAERLGVLTPLPGGVSAAVRAQYEASPYPRWTRVVSIPPVASIWGRALPPRPQVLFAGCGTGRHAIHAGQRYGREAQVLAIDLSRASLAYAARRAQEAGIANVDFAQADLLELASMGRTFDVIECSGVLHHLADPFAGARTVAGQLRPGGLMKLGLYSAAARAALKPAKALARTFGPGRIPELRAAIMASPPGDPVRAAMRYSDFYATSACRDLLLHVQEHELTPADLGRMMQENGLQLLGFAVDPAVRAAYRAMFPDDPAALDLDHWAQFERERPQTFSGMYQFWTQKRVQDEPMAPSS